MTLRVRDFFAGAGGWDLAVRAVYGTDPLGYETMADACATRDAAGLRTLPHDVRGVDVSRERWDVDVASPPCQTFSISGDGAGRRVLEELAEVVEHLRAGHRFPPPRAMASLVGDPRSALVLEPLRIALEGRSPYLAWEQVPPVLPVWEGCASVLRDVGYSVWTGILGAECFGTPQTRRRAVLIARSDGVAAYPPAHTHTPFRSQTDKLEPTVGMRDALGDLMDVPDSWVQRSNYSAPPVPGSTRASDRGRGFRPLDAPSLTITSRRMHFSPDASARLHPDARTITVAQSAVLQGFPYDHPFRGDTTSAYLQVGNAIPVPLAAAVLRTFL